MIIKIGDIWKLQSRYTPICITTNGFVKNNGECVMGRGIALQAKQRYPELPLKLGTLLKRHGNQVYYFGEYSLFTFPTKHNWFEDSDINLIDISATQLLNQLLIYKHITTIYITKAGCANGRLSWEDTVKPVLINKFTDNSNIIVCDII